MPIRAERRALYPKNWKAISLAIRERAGWQCEGSPGVYPECRAVNAKPHPVTGSKVVLTVAHLDHDETSADPANLRAMCQRCHLTYDRHHHAKNAAAGRRHRSAQMDLEGFTAPAA
jgi:5-methylcytosine-specific restriction endonuclease McrA